MLMATTPQSATDDTDLQLREDIRLLGRLLGDTLREQEGAAMFDLIENIRQIAIRFRHDRDAAGLPAQDGTIARALERCQAAGIDAPRLRAFFARALISLVLTAHPT